MTSDFSNIVSSATAQDVNSANLYGFCASTYQNATGDTICFQRIVEFSHSNVESAPRSHSNVQERLRRKGFAESRRLAIGRIMCDLGRLVASVTQDQEARPFETCSVVGMAGAGRTLVPGISARKGGPNKARKAKSRPPTSLGRVPVEPGSDQLGLARQDHYSGSLGAGHSSVASRQSSPVTPGLSSLVSPDGCHGAFLANHSSLPTAPSLCQYQSRLSLESQPRPENL